MWSPPLLVSSCVLPWFALRIYVDRGKKITRLIRVYRTTITIKSKKISNDQELIQSDPILTVQECQSYSQFHNRNYLSQIWQRAFARFLILPGELHLGGPKPNCHNLGLGAPILYKLPLLPPGGKNVSFSSGIQGFFWLCWGLMSQSTIFQSCRDGAIASWVINQYFRGVKCLAQGHNTAAVIQRFC